MAQEVDAGIILDFQTGRGSPNGDPRTGHHNRMDVP